MFAMLGAKIHNAHFTEKIGMADLVPGIKPEKEKQDVEAQVKRFFGVPD